jgi:hypothetical protein
LQVSESWMCACAMSIALCRGLPSSPQNSHGIARDRLTTTGLGPEDSFFLFSPGRLFLVDLDCCDPATGRQQTA